ncbi:MAG: DUF2079 domain-containing protein [Anaerolineae bacterium]|nr:DUF2079 domain-containing protein [Anaerolineae bacterium]
MSSPPQLARRSSRDLWAWIVLLLLVALYVGYFGAFSVRKHQAFQTHTSDLGNMDQPIWNTLHGRFVQETRHDGRQSSRLTDHFEPIFLLVSLVFLIHDDVTSLLWLQTAVLALGAVPAYAWARERLGSRGAGLAFAASYLLFPALQAANLTEFHASPLAVPLLLAALYFGHQRRHGWLAGFVFLSLTVKEEVALVVFMLGLYLFFVVRDRKAGAVVAAAGLVWFAVATFGIIAHHSRQFYGGVAAEGSIYFKRYAHLGGGLGGILGSLATRPGEVLALLATKERLAYWVRILAPVGFLAVLGPLELALAAPILAANLLADYPAMYSGEYHYSALVVPFAVAGAVAGAAWCVRKVVAWTRWPRAWVLGGVCAWLLAWSLLAQRMWGFTPLNPEVAWPAVTPHHQLLSRFAAQIPREARLSTTPPLNPHLSHREVIYDFPVVLDADYVLVDAASTTDMHPNDFHQAVMDLLKGDFCVQDAADGYLLLAREAGQAECRRDLPDAFYDFLRVRDPAPQYPLEVTFGGRLRLLGYDLVDQPKWRLTSLRMYWQALEPLAQDYRLYPFFLNRQGDVVEDTSQRPLAALLWYPTSRWRPGEVVAVETVPWDLGDWFAVAVGVVEGPNWAEGWRRLPVEVERCAYPWRLYDGGTWARLHRFARMGERLRLVPPDTKLTPDHPLEAEFGGLVRLLGYDLQVVGEAEGRALLLTLYWQALVTPDRDYTGFVHLLDGTGQRVAQSDAQPDWNGPVPTTTWRPGEVVKDVRRLPLPASLDQPPYRLWVGWYWWETGERLPARVPGREGLSDHLEWEVDLFKPGGGAK